jgi:hypothetical protein
VPPRRAACVPPSRFPFRQDYVILNCDDHPDYLRKHKRDPADYRPDILHQARGEEGGGCHAVDAAWC